MINRILGIYDNPVIAAFKVYLQNTGNEKWDLIDFDNYTETVPSDVSQWNKSGIMNSKF